MIQALIFYLVLLIIVASLVIKIRHQQGRIEDMRGEFETFDRLHKSDIKLMEGLIDHKNEEIVKLHESLRRFRKPEPIEELNEEIDTTLLDWMVNK